jgi:HEAT repeat protein
MKSPHAALLFALLPSVGSAQSFVRQIERVRNGTVQLTYAARPGLCGDGRETIRSGSSIVVLPSMFGRGRSDMNVCFTGPVRAAIGRSDGESISYRVHVGGHWASVGDATDLGTVSAPDAARYFLDEAVRANGRNAEYALAAAVFADSVDLTPDLVRIARSSDAKGELRSRAVFYIATYDDPAATRTLRQLAGQDDLDEDVRGSAIIALGREDMTDDDVNWLRNLYPGLSEKLRDNVFLAVSQSDGPTASRWLASVVTDARQSEHTRQQAMFWLGQGHGPTTDLVRLYDKLDDPSLRNHYTFVLSQRHDGEALDKLIDVAQHDRDKSVRRQALFWLGQSKDPRALAFIRDLVTR